VRRDRNPIAAAAWALAAALPLIGLGSLLLRSRLDPHWDNHRVHFVVFLSAGLIGFVLATASGRAARRRADPRVLLISLAFLATGGFLALHAVGTPGVLFSRELTGFQVAVPVGLLVAALFAAASAFADAREGIARAAIRHQGALQALVVVTVGAWFACTVLELPPLDRPSGESAVSIPLEVFAGLATVLYCVAAARYLAVYRAQPGLLPASITACFVLLAEAMVGVATTGERAWHASWWEWHGLILIAFLLVAFSAQREWRDERFRTLYLPTTRERTQDVSVLFSDLAGFTPFTERSEPPDVAAMLKAYYELAAPTIVRAGGEIEHFVGDGLLATFNTRGNRPDHAARAARAALDLQRQMARLTESHPSWPRARVGVNTGTAIVREMGGRGHVAYTVVGDSVNVGARLEEHAPVGGVLIGEETYRRLPEGCVAEAVPALQVKGRDMTVDAYVLVSMPAREERPRSFTWSRP
jgi:class 3 adenylate cyclase